MGGASGSNAAAGSSGSGGSGGMTAGAGGLAGIGGTAGASGTAGMAGGGGATGGSGGATNCSPGHALSLGTNGSGTGTSGANNDAAAARVDLDFSGTSDLPVGNANRTIEYWAYVPSADWVGNANTMFFYGSTNRPAKGFGLDFGSNAVNGNHATLDPYTNGGFDDDDQPSGLSPTMDQWVHFAMTWDGTAVRTFVNGVEKITKTGDSGVTMLATDTSPITIGGYAQDGNFFNGIFDEFRVWNVARSAGDITATMNKTLVGNEAGLVAYLKFDETAGTTASDSVTTQGHTAHTGVLKSNNGNLPTFVPSTAPLVCP
jgi:hypothetical protein